MESHHLREVEEFVRFGSNSKHPFYKLSNFWKFKTELNDKIYPSVEHAFQAELVESSDEYISTGPIGAFSENAFRYVGVDEKDVAKKLRYWASKDQVGILAKMRINIQKKQGLKQSMTSTQCKDLFLKLLRQKYAHPEMQQILLATGNQYLLEFDRSAERRFKKGDITRWGGMVKNGRVIGHNQMGVLLMRIRTEIQTVIKLSL